MKKYYYYKSNKLDKDDLTDEERNIIITDINHILKSVTLSDKDKSIRLNIIDKYRKKLSSTKNNELGVNVINENSLTKVKFISKNPKEILRLVKANDMAFFIWELVHNGWRGFKHTDYDYEKSWNKIRELLSEHNIDIDELID